MSNLIAALPYQSPDTFWETLRGLKLPANYMATSGREEGGRPAELWAYVRLHVGPNLAVPGTEELKQFVELGREAKVTFLYWADSGELVPLDGLSSNGLRDKHPLVDMLKSFAASVDLAREIANERNRALRLLRRIRRLLGIATA